MISTFVDISGAEGVETRAMGMRAIDEINREVPRRSKGRAVLAGTASVGFGAVAALVVAFIGLVTFGVQATVEPSHVPLAVGPSGTSAAGALAPVVSRVAAQGGDAVDWRRVGSRAGAERLLDRKEVYGALLFNRGPEGLTATILVSGALNPSATQVAQPLLTQVAENVTTAARAQAARDPIQPSGGGAPARAGPPIPSVRVVAIHPTSPAGRIFPLAATSLLWLTTLLASLLVLTLGPRLREGRQLGPLPRFAAALSGALFGTGMVLGLARLWEANLLLDRDVVSFLVLVAVGFAMLQAGILSWLGLRGFPLLGVLYLMAPAVAGQVPELLNPVYRAALWSWTPFRFSTEGVRSLLFLGSGVSDVRPAIWIFAGLALGGLALLLIPKPRQRETSLALHPDPERRRVVLASLLYLLLRRDSPDAVPEPLQRELLAAVQSEIQRGPHKRVEIGT